MADRLTEPPLSTYVAAHLAGWTAAAVVAWGLASLAVLPWWAGALLAGTVVAKDVLSYRGMRHYYTPEPPERRLLEYRAVAVTPLAPRGLVRVRGELWQACVISSADEVPAGALLRVRGVQGLVLMVESLPASS